MFFNLFVELIMRRTTEDQIRGIRKDPLLWQTWISDAATQCLWIVSRSQEQQ